MSITLTHIVLNQFALRWRTEAEVLSGAGETTCGNTRCERYHSGGSSASQLTTLELPFAYEEHGENKSALVKIVLCSKCVKKLMWKRTKEKEKEVQGAVSKLERSTGAEAEGITGPDDEVSERRKERRRHRNDEKETWPRKRNSRSLSPRRRSASEAATHIFKRSPS